MAVNSKKKNSDDDFLIDKLALLVEAIAKTFGSNCEVVLHDLRQLDKSIIKIEHGYITGRKVGSSVTDLALRTFREDMTNDILLNYKTKTKNGKTLKSSTVIIRNKKKVLIAALCINIDISNLQVVSSVLSELCTITEEEGKIAETFERDLNHTIGSIIDNVISSYHINVPDMQKEDRIRIITKLDEQGVFLVKGAIKIMANILKVSKYAVYNYLEEIRSTRGKP